MTLAGKRVLVARAEGQTETPARLLREHGAIPVVIPSIVIGPPTDPAPLREALSPARLAETDWVVFTSSNGVEHTWRVLLEQDGALEALSCVRFAVVGTSTRDALMAHGAEAHLLAREFRGEGVARALLETMKPGTGSAPRVLILRAEEASDVLPDALLAAGALVRVVAAYRTARSVEGAAEIERRLAAGELDVVVFSSGSTVTGVCDALGDAAPLALAPVLVACIGPVTAEAALARGIRVDVVPPVATFPAVIEALELWFRAI